MENTKHGLADQFKYENCTPVNFMTSWYFPQDTKIPEYRIERSCKFINSYPNYFWIFSLLNFTNNLTVNIL